MAPNETMFVSSEVAATKHSLASNLHNIKLNKKKKIQKTKKKSQFNTNETNTNRPKF